MRVRGMLVVVGVAALVPLGCEELPERLDEYCDDDPMTEWCPGGGRCSGPFECVSYCIRHFPQGEGEPEAGMGAWCGDERMPDDFAVFCDEHPEVRGCDEWCAAHEGACTTYCCECGDG